MSTDRVMSPGTCRSGLRHGPHSIPLSHRVVLASGWARRLVALLAGAAGALAMAPIGFFPAMAVSLSARGLADRRLGAIEPRQAGPDPLSVAFDALRLRGRLVVGFRLFHRRPVLDRLGLPGRGRSVRLGAAVRGYRPAGGPRRLPGPGLRSGARLLDAGCRAHPGPGPHARHDRVAARHPVHGLSLERPRHDAGHQSRSGPGRKSRRPARPHDPDDPDLRRARHAGGSPS